MAKEIVLALGGGGLRGVAHLGVFRCLEDHGYQIKGIAGTSAGSLAGGVYAAGASLDSIREHLVMLFMKPDFRREDNSKFALLGMQGIHDLLMDLIGDQRIESLAIPFAAVATAIESGKAFPMREGSLIEAILASCSIPGAFPSREIDGIELVDGAVTDPVPVTTARSFAPRLPVVAVALHCRPADKDSGDPALPRLKKVPTPIVRQVERTSMFETLKVTLRSAQLMMDELTELKLNLDKPDILVCPEVGHYPVLDDHIPEGLEELGYKAMESKLEDLEEANNLLNSYKRIIQYGGTAAKD